MPQDVKATANGKLGARELIVQVEFGTSLAEAVEKFGEAVVFNTFKAQAIVKLQSFMRTKMEAITKEDPDNYANDDDAVRADIVNWALPTGTRTRVSKVEKARKLLEEMGIEGEQLEALLDKVRVKEAAASEEVPVEEAGDSGLAVEDESDENEVEAPDDELAEQED